MGDHSVNQFLGKTNLRDFSQHVFRDLQALDRMLKEDMFEKGITRIGAEQEMCLIDNAFRPAPIAMEVLETINDPHFTNELSRFNLEINLDPQEFTADCFMKMENQLKACLSHLSENLRQRAADYILVGILPTIRRSDLGLHNLTPYPRYYALNEAILRMRGGPYEFRIDGNDELVTQHDTVMFESCNTSFQIHYQVEPKDFAKRYNWAQAITGPVLSVATNSPLLLGHRLWRETRIALFQQAADTRNVTEYSREMEPRVFFGSGWLQKSVIEIFREEVARYRIMMSTEIEENALEMLDQGKVPQLRALRLHNGTIYTWNRACYGITDGKPHLRIENRVLPSGPTVIDEMANSALWLGLMHGMPKEYENLHLKADFEIVKSNFIKAAKMGMGSMFRWVNNKVYSAQELMLKELLPIARDGLEKANIRPKDISKYLDVIQERAETGKSGSQWILDSFNNLKKKGTKEEAIVATTAGIVKRQKANKPVSKWSKAKIDEAGSWINRYWRIDQIMSRNLYTVQEEDLIDLAPNIMSWREIRDLPVENEKGEFVGLLTVRELLQHYAGTQAKGEIVTIGDVMQRKVLTITDEMNTIDAISLLRKNKISSLPVLNAGGKLVGIVTERDFVNVADHLLHEFIEDIENAKSE